MFHGSMVALVTPMFPNGKIDEAAFDALIALHIREGTSGIIVAGTTGESATLTVEEKLGLFKRAVDQAKAQIPIIAGTGEISTAESIALTRAAQRLGVDACLLMTPAYVKPTQQGLYQHYKAIAEAVPIPQILYNVPSRTAVDLLPETVIELAKMPNIIGIKEATADLSRVKTLQSACGDTLDLYSGDDKTACDFVLAGGAGVISVTANLLPREMASMIAAARAKDFDSAKQQDARLQAVHSALFLESNPIPIKAALASLSLIPNGIRLPLTNLSSEPAQVLHAVLRKLELI